MQETVIENQIDQQDFISAGKSEDVARVGPGTDDGVGSFDGVGDFMSQREFS